MRCAFSRTFTLFQPHLFSLAIWHHTHPPPSFVLAPHHHFLPLSSIPTSITFGVSSHPTFMGIHTYIRVILSMCPSFLLTWGYHMVINPSRFDNPYCDIPCGQRLNDHITYESCIQWWNYIQSMVAHSPSLTGPPLLARGLD